MMERYRGGRMYKGRWRQANRGDDSKREEADMRHRYAEERGR